MPNVHVANTDELQEVLRPINSLISKSEKAQQKLALGTWQHTMLRDNLKALHIASALLSNETDNTHSFTRDDLEEALRAFASMIRKTEKAQVKFEIGTSQHTLMRNRLKALLISEAVIKSKLGQQATEQGAAPDRLQPTLWSFLPSLRLPAAGELGRCAAARS